MGSVSVYNKRPLSDVLTPALQRCVEDTLVLKIQTKFLLDNPGIVAFRTP